MTRLVSLAATTAFVATLAVAAAPAVAGSTRTITSGLGCVQAYGVEGKTSYGDDGALYSDATDWWRTAVCRLQQSTPYMVGVSAAVDVFDRHYTQDVSCRVVARGPWTTWGAAASSSGSGPGAQRLNLELSLGDHQLGNAHVLCYLPATYQGNRSGVLAMDATLRSLF